MHFPQCLYLILRCVGTMICRNESFNVDFLLLSRVLVHWVPSQLSFAPDAPGHFKAVRPLSEVFRQHFLPTESINQVQYLQASIALQNLAAKTKFLEDLLLEILGLWFYPWKTFVSPMMGCWRFSDPRILGAVAALQETFFIVSGSHSS